MKYKKMMKQMHNLDVKKEKKKQKEITISLLEQIQNEIDSSPVKALINDEIDEAMPGQGFSSPEAHDILLKEASRWTSYLRKASHKIIKEMVNGVKTGKYDPMDIARTVNIKYLSVGHGYEFDFIKELWLKVRDKFRKYISKGKLRRY